MRAREEDRFAGYREVLASKNARLLLVSTSALSLVRGVLPWLLPIVLMDAGGPLLLGAAFAIANIDDMIVAFLGGALADRYGRKPILLFSAAMYIAGALLLIPSTFAAGALSRGTLVAAVFFLYGMTGISSGSGSALLVESVSEKCVGRAFSMLGAVSLACRALGSAVLGVIYLRNPSWAIVAMVILTAIAAVPLGRVHETLKPKAGPGSISMGRHFTQVIKQIWGLMALGLLPIVMLVILNGLGHGTSGNFFAPYLQESFAISPALLGGLYAIMSLVQAVVMIPAGWSVDRHGPRISLIAGNVIAGVLLGAFAVVRQPAAAVGIMLASAGFGSFHALGYKASIAKISEDLSRATLFGGLDTIWNATFVLGPLIGGALFRNGGKLPFLCAGAMLSLTVFPILALRATGRQPNGPEAGELEASSSSPSV